MAENSTVLRIAPAAWEKLWLYISLCPAEVGGLGRLEVEPDGTLVLADCFLVDQEVTDVETTLDAAAISSFLIDYIRCGGDPTQLQVWWHSHARESVFWSTDDERTIDQWLGESLVAVVGNHAGRFLARRDWYRPIRRTEGWLQVDHPRDRPDPAGSLATAIRQELAAKVRRRPRMTNKIWTDGDLPRRHG